MVEKYFTQAIQIVDWYQASQYLTPVAEAAFGADTSQAKEWLAQARTDLWEGRIQEAILAYRTFLRYAHIRPFVEKTITYYTYNEK